MALFDKGSNLEDSSPTSQNEADHEPYDWAPDSKCLLARAIGRVRPQGHYLKINHISTHPTSCSPLYTQAPGHEAEETWCEKHFLLASLQVCPTGNFPVYGLEVLIYKTEYLTTIFVSKADSTGFMPRSTAAPWALSPMTALASTFLGLLADTHKRKNTRLVICLFARAQPAYIFLGSEKNKNILDDADLIRWWTRVMDIVTDSGRKTEPELLQLKTESSEALTDSTNIFIRVPGYSAREIRRFVPQKSTDTSCFRLATSAFLATDPLNQLARFPDAPARCMIPHFYDDPKTRFAEELENYDRVTADGNWSSVASLEAFWDMLQYRQECGAGRLVGFVWGVFTPSALHDSHVKVAARSNRLDTKEPSISTEARSAVEDETAIAPETKITSKSLPNVEPSTEQVAASEARLKAGSKSADLPGPALEFKISYTQKPMTETYGSSSIPQKQVGTKQHISSPPDWYEECNLANGEVVLSEPSYDSVQKWLTTQGDFSTKEGATAALQEWSKQVCDHAHIQHFGYTVEGVAKEPESIKLQVRSSEATVDNPPDIVNEGVLSDPTKKQGGRAASNKRNLVDLPQSNDGQAGQDVPSESRDSDCTAVTSPSVNLLSGGTVRKKAKLG